MNAMIVAMGFVYGGAAQIIAGIFEWKKDNIIGFIAFTSYGFFWWSLAFIFLSDNTDFVVAADKKAMGYFFLIWTVFTFGMFIAVIKRSPIVLILVFFTLVFTQGFLALYNFTEIVIFQRLSGYIGIVNAIISLYNAFAEILNEIFGRIMLPLGNRPLCKKKIKEIVK